MGSHVLLSHNAIIRDGKRMKSSLFSDGISSTVLTFMTAVINFTVCDCCYLVLLVIVKFLMAAALLLFEHASFMGLN